MPVHMHAIATLQISAYCLVATRIEEKSQTSSHVKVTDQGHFSESSRSLSEVLSSIMRLCFR